MKCPRVKPDGRVCGGLMEIHGWNKDTGEIRYVCTKCRYEEVIPRKVWFRFGAYDL